MWQAYVVRIEALINKYIFMLCPQRGGGGKIQREHACENVKKEQGGKKILQVPVDFFLKAPDDPPQLNLGLFPELAVHHTRMREAPRARDLSGRHSAAN